MYLKAGGSFYPGDLLFPQSVSSGSRNGENVGEPLDFLSCYGYILSNKDLEGAWKHPFPSAVFNSPECREPGNMQPFKCLEAAREFVLELGLQGK